MENKNLKKVKLFDCVKMKNDIQQKLFEKMKNMSFAEQREYIQKVLNANLQTN